MKLKKILYVLSLMVLTLSVQAQEEAIVGKWINPSGEGQLEIYRRQDKVYGKLVWMKDPHDEKGKPRLDIKNPDPALRSKPLLGLELLKNFSFKNGKWEDGTIYDPKTGKTYSCILTLKDPSTLNIRGFIGVSLIGRSESWKRVK